MDEDTLRFVGAGRQLAHCSGSYRSYLQRWHSIGDSHPTRHLGRASRQAMTSHMAGMDPHIDRTRKARNAMHTLCA